MTQKKRKYKRKPHKVHHVMITDKLFRRAEVYAKDEGVPTDQWIRDLLRDHLDMLDKFTPHRANGERKPDRRTHPA